MNNKRIMTLGMGMLFSSALVAASSKVHAAKPSLSDTTQVHGLGDVVVTDSLSSLACILIP